MLVEGCKHEIEITVPVDEITRETDRVVANIQQKVRLPGFRPGKAPASLIRTKFAHQVREDVIENLLPKYFDKRVKEEELQVVGRPNVKDVNFKEGEPLKFKAEFEVAPSIELGEYRGVTVHYAEPEVTDADIDKRLDDIREQKAQHVNVEPRPAADGDYAVVSLDSLAGVEEPIHQDEMVLHVGDKDTLPGFSDALRGMSPEEEKEFEVTYPEDYGQERLAGKTVKFRMKLKVIRTKELPELNDEFAQDLGDYPALSDLREAIRKAIFHEREFAAQQKAKDELLDKLIETHDFPVPETYIERQIEAQLTNQFKELADRGVDPAKLKIDWAKLKEHQRPKALHDVKGSLLIDKVAERETIHATNEEVDHEVQRIAKQEREPVAAMRKKLDKDGLLGRIAYRIRGEKTLNFLFEHARKDSSGTSRGHGSNGTGGTVGRVSRFSFLVGNARSILTRNEKRETGINPSPHNPPSLRRKPVRPLHQMKLHVVGMPPQPIGKLLHRFNRIKLILIPGNMQHGCLHRLILILLPIPRHAAANPDDPRYFSRMRAGKPVIQPHRL
jgi:trigger factor